MDIFAIARRSATHLWTHKALWFFGFFVAALGSGGSSSSSSSGAGGTAGATAEALPMWLVPAVIAALAFALGALVLNVISESALIDAIRRLELSKDESDTSIKTGLRVGLYHFWPMAKVKLLFFVVTLALVGVAAAPILLAVFGLASNVVGIGLGVTLALAAVPLIIMAYLASEYAMRFVVFDGRGAIESYEDAVRYLHGRLEESLWLALADAAGRLVGMAGLALAVIIVGGAFAGLGYLLAGLPAAIGLGLLVVLPMAIPAVGAIGTYRSSVWTLGFMEGRSAS